MAIKRYKANADTTIVNAYKEDLSERGTGSNMGRADVMEVFSIYGRQTTSSQELSRTLVKFPISSISTDRTNGVVPASGSVSFYLRMFNAPHSRAVPDEYKLMVMPVSRSWQEGIGLDLENYSDEVKNNTGANWMSCSKGTPWTLVGGDYMTASGDPLYSQTFTTGLEDLEINISDLVEKWIAGTISNNGVGIHLTASQEAWFSGSATAMGLAGNATGSVLTNPDGATVSYYTKRFFARGSQFFFKRPVIEARWDDRILDDRGDFMYSSSLAPSADNLNVLYLYNYVRGRLTNIPGLTQGANNGEILVSLYSGSSGPLGGKLVLYDGNTELTGGHVSTGIYSCSLAITAAADTLLNIFDVWHSGGVEYSTGSIVPEKLFSPPMINKPVYYMKITNLQDKYRQNETARFGLFVRDKNWSPTIYTVANTAVETTTIHSASYRVYRLLDGYEAIPYGTGSDFSTVTSYNVSGNYFDFDMSLLQPGYAYGIKFAFYDNSISSWAEQPYVFKFRVEDYEY